MASKSKIEILLSAKDTGLTAAFAKAKVQISLFSRTMSTATAPMRSLVSGALSLKSALAGIVTGAGLSALGKSLIDAGKGMDSLNLSFVAIAGSSQGAAREMEFVRTTADTLGLDLLTTATAYKQISAAAMGTSMAGKQTQAIFTAVAKASTTLGLSADETSGALLAISQMISKGKISAEELRGQLGERLPGAFQIAAQAMGMTTGELDKFMADGKLMAEDFLPKFAVALEQRFGKSAETAANTFTGASNRIGSGLSTLKGALGQAVTNNNFFVTALGKVSTSLAGLSKDATDNAAKWREWAKQSALAVLQFVADSADGFNDVYKSLSFLAGTLKLAYGGALTLGKGFQWLFEQANKLTGNTEKADYWAKAQVESTRLIEGAMAGAVKSFDAADKGSETLTKAAEKIKQLKQELSKVESTEVIPSADVAKTAEQIVKIGGVWRNVTKDIKETNADTTKEVNVDWGRVWNDVEKNGVSAAEAVDKALDRATRAREAVINVKTVEGRQHGGLIGGYRLGGLLQQLAAGGGVRNILGGGHLPGFGGGDKNLLLGENGEVMLRKESVKAGGLRAALAFNEGRFDIVIEELRKRMGNTIGYRLGGLIDSLPKINIPSLTSGGMVPATQTTAVGYSASYTFTDQSGHVGRVYGSPVDVKALEKAVNKHNRFRSTNR